MQKLDRIADTLGIQKPSTADTERKWKQVTADAIGFSVPQQSRGDMICFDIISEMCQMPVHIMISEGNTLRCHKSFEALGQNQRANKHIYVLQIKTDQGYHFNALTFVLGLLRFF